MTKSAHLPKKSSSTTDEILHDLADVFAQKNADYGSADLKYAKILAILIDKPESVFLDADGKVSIRKMRLFGIFSMILTKVIRYANLAFNNTNRNFESTSDTAKDMSVYASMMASADSSREII